MARDNFEKCLQQVLLHEGLWSDHPDDPGGATMKGVTIGTFAGFKGRKVTKAELRAISDDDLRAIYRRKYWDVVRGDDLPPGLDLVAFDAAVNSGPRRGAQWLQAGVGVTADGKVGPETLAHARAANVRLAIGRALDARLAFLKRLKTWPTFGRGWQRRVDDVRRVALEMAYAPAPIPTAKETGPEAPKVDAQSTTPKPANPTLWQMIVQLFREN